MTGWHQATRTLLFSLVYLCVTLPAHASQYFGRVSFASLPVPGATVTATPGGKTITMISDEGGVFRFPDLPDGKWKIEVKMLCFETLTSDVEIVPNLPAA